MASASREIDGTNIAASIDELVVDKCAHCGQRGAHRPCGVCARRGIKAGPRYCASSCQKKNWAIHEKAYHANDVLTR